RAPVIGVTGPATRLPWAWWATRWQLARAGARAVRLTPDRGHPEHEFDGIVLGGGNDIDPAIYGGDPSHSPNVDPVRDAFELTVLAHADKLGVPVLGICRGAQLLNVHYGGRLHGDVSRIRRLTSNRATLLPRKAVQVDEGSVLGGFLGATATRVNSLHHQAVSDTGRNLVVSARDRDDIVQAIESTAGPLRLGVQWHPEYLPQRQDQRRLFAAFVRACRSTPAANASNSRC
ncbi:MAG: gamma-glutamyl-gamma-aminobutyrate hydrolase family protein, partial [Woeseiaceae bacterium]|nr:gamma-glutamyl-gamma-aminobutyrate hydrolase family protein [Woeseiaceae bacterium]